MTRGWKVLRNLLLSVLLGLAAYGVLGFPALTVRQMLDQAERQLLLSDLEPLLVEQRTRSFGNTVTKRRDTYLLARSGGAYLATDYSREGLTVHAGRRWGWKLGQGAVCAACDGTLYIAGDFPEAASAQVEVEVQKTLQRYDPGTETFHTTLGERRTLRYPGERINGVVFSFRYRRENWDAVREVPESAYGLEEIADSWYRCSFPGGAYGSVPVDLPVKLTLYAEDGGVLKTVDLTIRPQELRDDVW